jgi:hypothetical protein
MIPSVGRIVHFKITAGCAAEINKRRSDASTSKIAATNSGAVVHVGSKANEGDVYPLLITRLWTDEPGEQSAVNGQVFLDGNDSLWVTSAQQGDGIGQWSDPRG